MKNVILAAAMSVFVSAAAAGQEPAAAPYSVIFPGSIGGGVGSLSPSEPGNIISQVAFEQGVVPWQHGSIFVAGFARMTIGKDTQGLTWNNRAPAMFGVRLAKVTATSVLQLNAGASRAGQSSGPNTLSRAVYASYWAGWRGARRGATQGFRPDAFPGSVSAVSGLITPLEPRNWITSASVEQGVTLIKRQGTSLIPFTRAAAGSDTQKLSWNNRMSVEGGTKLRRMVPGGILDLGVSERYQYDRITRTARTSPVVFAEFWIGWNPRSLIR
jgi:hypothetical protein